MSIPVWTHLAHEVAKKAEDDESYRSMYQTLPRLLSSGTSALEVARRTSVGTKDAQDALDELATHDLVRSSSSGATVKGGSRLYSMRGEGRKFFTYLSGLISSSSTS